MWIVRPFDQVVTKGKQIFVFTFPSYRTLSLHYHAADNNDARQNSGEGGSERVGGRCMDSDTHSVGRTGQRKRG